MKKLLFLIGLFTILMTSSIAAVMEFEGEHDPVWYLKAYRPLLIGGYGDNFNYDGSRVVELTGEAKVFVNVERDTGTIEAVINGTINPEKDKTYTGEVRIVYHVEPQPDGPAFWENGVADFVYLHGSTGQGPSVMPKVKAYLAAWVPVDVYVNGELIYERIDGHIMYTERSRDPETGKIYDAEGMGVYSAMDPDNASIFAPEEKELHIVAHTVVADPDNFPPHTAWIHINFVEVADFSYSGK